MKISELIEMLQDEQAAHGDREVVLVNDYGDITHTKQALPIVQIECVELYDSAYSQSGQAVVEPDDDYDEIDGSEDEIPVYNPEASEDAVIALSAVRIEF